MSEKIDENEMICRAGCGACCIEISISSPIPGLPEGKPAGTRCIHLDKNNQCYLHKSPDYPPVCREFMATREICGTRNEHAFTTLRLWEKLTEV